MITSVVAADIVGADTSNLSDPVTLTFRAEDNVTIDASACVYWDFKASGGRGNWSSEGCSLAKVCASILIFTSRRISRVRGRKDLRNLSLDLRGLTFAFWLKLFLAR